MTERVEEHHVFPNGSCVHYIDPGHAWWSCSGEPDHKRIKPRLPGASTIGGVFDTDNGRLLNWAARTDREGIARLCAPLLNLAPFEPEEWEWLTHPDRIKDHLKKAGLTYSQQRDKKADTGTNVHLAFEDLARGQVPDVAAYPEEERGCVQALLNWWMFTDPKVLNVEQAVYSAKHGYAGRFDLRARIGDKIAIIDAKTSSWLSPSFHTQLALYKMACEETGLGTVDETMILQVQPDGKYREVWGLGTDEDALAALSVYRRAALFAKAVGLPREKAA